MPVKHLTRPRGNVYPGDGKVRLQENSLLQKNMRAQAMILPLCYLIAIFLNIPSSFELLNPLLKGSASTAALSHAKICTGAKSSDHQRL
jgi:hypothetical protein